MPAVSVIIPLYNTEKYIEECIESIENQTLKDIEIIVVDDGSTDRSVSIVDMLRQKDERIKLIKLDRNRGVGEARNRGLDAAEGDYILFIDSDDFIKKDMCEKMIGEAQKTGAEMVLCDTDTFSSDGRKKTVWYKPIYGQFELKDLFHNTHPTNKLISRRLIERTDFRFLQGMGEGIIFELMINAKYISTVPEKLYVYRSREASLSTTPNIEKNLESLANNREMGRRNPDYFDYFEFKAIEDLLQIVANSIKTGDRPSFDFARKELKKMSYLRNKYVHTLLKQEYPFHRYVMKVYVLPLNYSVSRIFRNLSKS